MTFQATGNGVLLIKYIYIFTENSLERGWVEVGRYDSPFNGVSYAKDSCKQVLTF